MASSVRTTCDTSTPAFAVSASSRSPSSSRPTAATRLTGVPSRARFSATLRPTPPAEREMVPGLLVAGTARSRLRARTSTLAPPMTTAPEREDGESGMGTGYGGTAHFPG